MMILNNNSPDLDGGVRVSLVMFVHHGSAVAPQQQMLAGNAVFAHGEPFCYSANH
ncbi:hypothetical protein [Methylophilus sp. QUAN]|uniref:hypothetical protein n=1 Tax=Methylophilus sp. QUAN TaxID=2781020 RepID=UPI00188F5648|nr:hypothetical protein [Methylophilus sp. QUAN]MBF4989980.1 hypothetical protein [Methylophilus sp. QUAN]